MARESCLRAVSKAVPPDRILPYLARLQSHRERIIESMASAVKHDVPAYEQLTNGGADALQRSIAEIFDLLFEITTAGRWLTPAEAHGIQDVGRTRYDQGLKLADLKEAVHVAVGIAVEEVVNDENSTASTSPNPTHFAIVINLLRRFEADVVSLLEKGYTDRRDERRPTRTVRKLLVDVLDGRLLD